MNEGAVQLNEVKLLPQGWRWLKLGDVCQIIMGQSPPGHTYNKNGEGLPFFQGKVDFCELYPMPSVWCTQPMKTAEPNDILISVRAPVGPTNLCDQKCCIGRGLAAIRAGDKVETSFVLFFLRLIENQFSQTGQGSTFGAVTRDHLESISIPLPSLPEQKRIATKIQELMAEVERARTACEARLEAAKALPQAYLRQVFESEEAKKWERRRLGEVCEVIMGQSPPGDTYNRRGEGLPFFQGKLDFGEMYPTVSFWCTHPQKIAEPGDILISVRAPVGPTNLCNQRSCIGRGLAAIRSRNNVEALFVLHFLRFIEKSISEIGQGSTFGAIKRSDIEGISFPFPSFTTQQSIATELKDKITSAEKLRASIEKELEAIKALPQAILRKAFRGEL